MMRSGRVRYTDILVLLVIGLLGCAYALAAVEKLNEDDARKQCASNLRQFGQAFLLYSNENRGAYPRTIASHGAHAKPTWGTPYEQDPRLKETKNANPFAPDDKAAAACRPAPDDVTAAMWLLQRTQDIKTSMWICPSTRRQAWDLGQNSPLQWTNWRGVKGLRDHLSYSMVNPYPSSTAIGAGYKYNNTLSANFAMMADMNPGAEALLKISTQSDAIQVRAGNSLNHRRDGQNVLYGDGHVEFVSTPFAGAKHDNIFTFGTSGTDNGKTGSDGIVGSPVGPDDSVLLPTATALGIADAAGRENAQAVVKEITPQDKAKLQAGMMGNYSQKQGTRTLHLRIDSDVIVATVGPLSARFTYAIDGLEGENVLMTLRAPDTHDTSATLVVVSDGVLVTGNSFLEGHWTKQASAR